MFYDTNDAEGEQLNGEAEGDLLQQVREMMSRGYTHEQARTAVLHQAEIAVRRENDGERA